MEDSKFLKSLSDNRLSVKLMNEKKGCECDPKNWRISYRTSSKSAVTCTRVIFISPGGQETLYTIETSFMGRNQELTYAIPEASTSTKIRFESCGVQNCAKLMNSGFSALSIRSPVTEDQAIDWKSFKN